MATTLHGLTSWLAASMLVLAVVAQAMKGQHGFHPRACLVGIEYYNPVQIIMANATTRVTIFSGNLNGLCSKRSESILLTYGQYRLEVTAGEAKKVLFNQTTPSQYSNNATQGFMTGYVVETPASPQPTVLVTSDYSSKPDINNCYLRVLNLISATEPAYVEVRNTQCYRCNNSRLDTVNGNALTSYMSAMIHFPLELSYSMCDRFSERCPSYANTTYYFGEFARYTLVLYNSSSGKESLGIVEDIPGAAAHGPDRMPVLYAFLILAAMAATYFIAIKCFPNTIASITGSDQALLSEEATPLRVNDGIRATNGGEEGNARSMTAIKNPKRSKKRLKSLDSFRGLALTIMIFVNFNGGLYYFFNHSPWNGLTVADLVFPWFMWIMGTSMAIVFNSLFQRETPKGTILYKIFRRSIILFAIGILIIGNLHDLRNGRIMGVLQRFGISYLGVGLILLFVPKLPKLCVVDVSSQIPALAIGSKRLSMEESSVPISSNSAVGRLLSFIPDVAPYVLEWTIIIIIIVIHACITFLLPVPNCPTGYIGPGGPLAEFGRFAELGPCKGSNFCCEGGASGYIDRVVLGWRHVYPEPTSQPLYFTGVYDPEGILGCLTSIVICYMGLHAGRQVVHFQSHRGRIVRWLAWSVITGIIATALCSASQNEGVIPVNKNLWSLSFILLMSSFAYFLLSLCYIVIDVLQWWGGEPFRYVGLNSIFIYVFHETFGDNFPLSWDWEHGGNTHGREMFMNITAVGILCLLCYYCFKIDFFVKI